MKKHVEAKKSLWKMGCLATMSLLWLVIRTGGKPSRITYPCQKAAVANIHIFLLALFAPVLGFGRFKTALPHALDSRLTTTVLLVSSLLLAFGSVAFTGNYISIQSSSVPVPLDLQTHNAISSVNSSDLFFVEDASGIEGNMDGAVWSLLQLMAAHDLSFFKTASQPYGLIGKNDVVIIKVNSEWNQRGGTNTDLVKSIVNEIVNHPEGFTGEVVIADNGQWTDRTDQSIWYTPANAYDPSQSMYSVANSFPAYKVSSWLWDIIRKIQVNEYSQGDNRDGYVVSSTTDPDTGIQVSWPKFRTKYGTYISLKDGIWTGSNYDSGRLKLINVPVLKSHGNFGVSGCIKHYMGVLTNALTDGHGTIANGAMGTEMAETKFPTLNILDAIWVNANPVEDGSPPCGPDTSYEVASYTNVIGASQDPVALDYWGAKRILIPAAQAKGYTSYSSLNPDYAPIIPGSPESESFHNYLLKSMNELKNHGFQVTMTESQMNVYVSSSARWFLDDFESGTLSAWTTAYGGGASAPIVQSITKNAGTYAAKCSITSAGSYSIGVKDLGTTYPTLYLRAYIRFSATPTVGNYLSTNPDIMDAAEYDVACAVIQNDNGTLKWGLRYCTDAIAHIHALDTTGKSVTANTWYRVEVMATTGAGTGKAALYVDGTKIIEVTGLSNLSHPLRKIQIGAYSSTALTADVYTDNVVASTSYSEPAHYGDVQPPFGTIDMKDVGYVARRFWCFPGYPLWDPNADFDGDGKIDMKDVALPARNFGVSY